MGYVRVEKSLYSGEIQDAIRKKSSTPVIPGKCNSKIGNMGMDWCLYKYRYFEPNLLGAADKAAVRQRSEKMSTASSVLFFS
ncbi:hypothetical protein D7270_02560 [Legionella pneumophila]|nr:hypothetical protein [Legionella pneumophila]OOD07435.1 hypothetical protein BWO97_05300 [Legionella pneumophila subsp. pneumophila ATCC 43290]PNL77676.1 hypothetical protein A6J41_007000 [Legionella pneumophila subsp. pneumophila]RYB30672.1 hypothetical protein D7227_13580 [Legionella pneumophila]RYB48041.1 hypothetical protein D7230_14470 [Legionella pneumophila]RYB53429.1 hypothetical protein D7265_12615 [Legionella pneumophila]